MLLNVWFHNSCQRNSLDSRKGEQAELRKGTEVYCIWILYFMAILAIYHLKKAEKPYLGSWYNLRCMEPDQSYAEQNFEHILWIKYSGTAGQL